MPLRRPSRNSRNSSEAGKGAYDWVFIDVIPAAGEPVSVMKANVHVGKAIVHGIGSVLAFNATSATDLVKNGSNTSTMAADMVPLNVLSVSPNATSTGARSSTAGSGRMAIPTANLAAATTTDTGGNRKLLQSTSGGGSGTYNSGSQDGPTIARNEASSDIRNAVFGNIRVRTATNRGVASKCVLEVLGQSTCKGMQLTVRSTQSSAMCCPHPSREHVRCLTSAHLPVCV